MERLLENNIVNVYGYIRVSTEGQVKQGYSLAEQRAEIEKYCSSKSYNLIEIFKDEGISGAKANEDEMSIERDGLLDMLASLKENKIQYIVVLSTNRLWRSDLVKVLLHRELKKNNVDIRAIDRPNYSIYTQNPNEIFVNGMFELLDVYERLEIALKLKRGRLQKAKDGGYAGGGAPFGYECLRGGKKLYVNGTVKKGGDYYNESGQKIKIMNNTQTEMGKISNLITDMTLKGATQDELARAVRHSMVVIDAEKHKLDYKKSEQDNGIKALKKKYQAHENDDGYGGAATLISRAKSETSVLKRKGSPIIDKETGEQSWKTVREEYVDKNGKPQVRTQKSTRMAETRDARTLSSGTPQEEAYADYANTMKDLANQARKEMVMLWSSIFVTLVAKKYH